MAKLFPEFFPYETNTENPEFEVFQSLRILPDNFSVFYSKKIKGGRWSKEECEIDFIIFDGKHNLLCMEVKGGMIEYNGAQDEWLQNGVPLKISPDRQVSASTHSLIEFLGKTIADINVGWCVCFPNCSIHSHIAPTSGIPRAIVIDEEGLLEVEQALSLVNKYHESRLKRKGCTSRTAKELVSKLTRSIGSIQKLGVKIARDRKQLLQVTDEQFQVLEDLMINPRVVVNGYAGSGKTLLAQEFAKRLADENKSVLLLFFNRMIANSVRYGLGRDSEIECTTFHSFARNQISLADPSWWNQQQDKKSDEFWDLVVPLKLSEVIIANDSKYDVIIVDEGQDFKREWYEILETYLKDIHQGNFCVFYDKFQDIFGHWGDLPWGDRVSRKVLSRNCRNTKVIVEYLRNINECEMRSFNQSPKGRPIIIRKPRGQEDATKLLKADIAKLLDDGVEPGQIVILIDKPRSDSILQDIKTFGRVKLESIDRNFRQGSRVIRYSNIKLFKGLESDIVISVQTSADSNQTYTNCSRARAILYHYLLEGIETVSQESPTIL